MRPLQAGFLLLASWACVYRARDLGKGLLGFSTIWVLVFLLLVLGLGEVQSRYSVLTAAPIALIAADVLSRRKSTEHCSQPTILFSLERIFLLVSVVILMFVLIASGIKMFAPAPLVGEAIDCNGKSVVSVVGRQSIMSPLPNGKLDSCLRIAIPIHEETQSVGVLLGIVPAPYHWQGWTDPGIEVAIIDPMSPEKKPSGNFQTGPYLWLQLKSVRLKGSGLVLEIRQPSPPPVDSRTFNSIDVKVFSLQPE
jgi:hypothetical protein